MDFLLLTVFSMMANLPFRTKEINMSKNLILVCMDYFTGVCEDVLGPLELLDKG